jgi:ketosteroid isomerase-like protein
VTPDAIGPDAAVAVAARFFDRMGHFDWEAMGACVAEDVDRVGPFRDQKSGRADYQQFLAETIEALDGYRLDVQRIWSDGAHVVAQLSETLFWEGRPRRTDEAIVLDIGPDGLIARVEVYLQKAYFVDDEDEIVRPSS